ncbi:MAG: hypothetical protein GTO24_20315 [candidate division Zixibacteria bacterium]|nr:hypothetical protein [candidate division Zixibacteria bacterium]
MAKAWLLSVFLLFHVFSASISAYGKPIDTIDDYPMRFAIIGDRTGEAQPGIYEQIVQEIQRMRPDFVITVGDMIEGPAPDTAETKRRWEEYQQLIQTLTTAVYFVPGNNDIWDSTSLEFYKRYVGEPYYSFDTRGVHFVILDNSRWNRIDQFSEEQLAWLTDDLKKNENAACTFVIFHIPYWIRTVADGKPDALHSLFVKYGVDVVFTGHYHTYFSGELDDIIYTGVGSSGGGCHPSHTGLEYHFTWVTLDADGINIAPIKMGAVLPWDEVTAAEFKLTEKMKDEAVRIGKPSAENGVTVPETRITVNIKNLSEHASLVDTLSWEIPAGWSVAPQDIPVQIGPLESHHTEFTVKCSGTLYPTPALSVQCPYAEGKNIEVSRALGVSRTVYAYKAAEPPTLDGKLTENIWKDPTAALFAPDGSPMFSDPISFYFAWDKDNLYLAAKCAEAKMDSIIGHATQHDGPVYAEDCVGYFLQPETEDGPMYQIYFNPLATPFDQKVMVKEGAAIDVDRDWNGMYEAKTFKGKDYWTIEVRIPLSQLETQGEPGKTWALNFRRKQKRLDTAGDWIVPLDYNPKDYGLLIMK